MCFGSAPEPPKIEYVGPDRSAIEANERALENYKQQMAMQQAEFTKGLQTQISDTAAETAALQKQLAAEEAAVLQETTAASNAAAAQANPYTVTTTETEAPATALTTVAKEKKKKNKNLKISTAGASTAAGTGLNIGV